MDCNSEHLRELPLMDLHKVAGAKFGAFAGWNMPLTYPMGVMKEHLHTRASAGLFDISHMKLILASGDDINAFLSYALPLDPASDNISQSRYSYLLNNEGGILDDLIVTKLGNHRYMIVVNAGNAHADIKELKHRAQKFNCQLEPLDRVFLALQGPMAADVLKDSEIDFGNLTFMHGFEPKADWFVSRSGYTGEDGFEIALPLSEAPAFAKKLVQDPRVEWIGLAARDSLRLEAGLCLHGNDITADDSPVEAGLTWALPKTVRDRAGFVGAKALLGALAVPPSRRRVGLKPETQMPVRHGAEIFNQAGDKVGSVTSGGFGPTFGGPIAMGYVATEFAKVGDQLLTHVRGKEIALSVYKLPFVPQRYFKG